MSFRRIQFFIVINVFISLNINVVHSQCEQDYFWAEWSNFTTNSATGTITTNNQTFELRMMANYSFDFTSSIYNYAAFNGFGGNLPPNTTVPRTRWSAGPGGETIMCFSETVSNPILLIASLGAPNIIASIEFSRAYITVFDGGGMTYQNDMKIIGQEGYSILLFPGEFDCITIYSSTPEFWTNITWGLNPPLFEIDFDGETVACENTTIVASGGNTYNWSGGSEPSSAINTFAESGDYFITVTDDIGCTVISSITIDIIPAKFESSQVSICEGDIYLFNGQSLTQAGQYESVIQTMNGCDSTITLNLEVDSPFFSDDSIETIFSYVWPINGEKYFQSGNYEAIFETPGGCDSVYKLKLIIKPSINVFIPDAFSPNADGINDNFTVFGDKSLERIESLNIYDRWGNNLASYIDFPPNDLKYGWDGRSSGAELNPGVYLYTVRVRFIGGNTAFYKGEITKTQ